jgi:hypothetical protein
VRQKKQEVRLGAHIVLTMDSDWLISQAKPDNVAALSGLQFRRQLADLKP